MHSFETRGSSFERGRQQGIACRDSALRTLAYAEDSLPAGDVSKQKEKALRWMDQAAQVLPEMLLENQGIAEGLALPFSDYARAFFAWRYHSAPTCSTFGCRDKEGHPLVGKTDDLLPGEIGMNVMQTARPDKGHAHVKFHPAGMVLISSGMNQAGLVVALTGLPGPAVDAPGVPALSLVDHLLRNCADVREAIEEAKRIPINVYGASLLFADRKGEMQLIEKNALATVIIPAQGSGWFAHTNHILDPQLSAISPAPINSLAENSRARYQTLVHLLSCGGHKAQRCEEFLKYEGKPASISQSGSCPLHTDYAILASPMQDFLKVWPGGPAKTMDFTVSNLSLLGKTA